MTTSVPDSSVSTASAMVSPAALAQARSTRYAARKRVNQIALTLSLGAMAFGVFWLVWILWETLRLGLGGLSLTLFTEMTPPPNEAGGLANALFGSATMVALATFVGTPIGILALALIVIPVVIRTTENMLLLVPASLREAAYALGAPKWKVITMVTLRAARAGVITGIVLAVARIAGETAPLLFTALNNQFWNGDLSKPMASLPVTIFKFAMSPYENWQQLAWAAVFLITLAVLGLNILARVLTRQK